MYSLCTTTVIFTCTHLPTLLFNTLLLLRTLRWMSSKLQWLIALEFLKLFPKCLLFETSVSSDHTGCTPKLRMLHEYLQIFFKDKSVTVSVSLIRVLQHRCLSFWFYKGKENMPLKCSKVFMRWDYHLIKS